MKTIILEQPNFKMAATLKKSSTEENQNYSSTYSSQEKQEKFVERILRESEAGNLEEINAVIAGIKINPKFFLLSTYAPNFFYKNDLYSFERKNGELKIHYKDSLFFRTGKEYSKDEMKILDFKKILDDNIDFEKIFPAVSENLNYILKTEKIEKRFSIAQSDKKTDERIFLHFNKAFKIEENSEYTAIHLNKFIEKPMKRNLVKENIKPKLLKIFESDKKISISENGRASFLSGKTRLDFSFNEMDFLDNMAFDERKGFLSELMSFLEKTNCTYSCKLLDEALEKLKTKYDKEIGFSDEIDKRIEILKEKWFC
jgi:hypothetical protein